MVWAAASQQFPRGRRRRAWGGAALCWVLLMVATPKIPYSPKNHIYADMRNFLGVPNTLNVITNFPFLAVGVVGFVFCLQGCFFNISLRGELLGWALFFVGIAGVAFGSAYYHLKPIEGRVMWDALPMMIAYASLFSSFVVERVGQRTGLCCFILLLLVALLSASYERTFNDLRLRMMFQLIPCALIPFMSFLFPSKYTHSRYWLWAAGVYLFSKFEALADKKIYHSSSFLISGHSLEHLCLSMYPVLLTVMLMNRKLKFQRLGDLKGRN
ncbi:uncharacterized protein LOC116201540 isoform X2 [Punica granatum]|uniref:Uncharacterized protein n=3 Tax=Punica granatum TaxID=22663 RepID=A0A2I0KQV5_PUNGR|nr:uncharacterized protein LOC116201540 isoform X2 [Punica granatum]PKI70700.1 hypothetical protein CRG98_008933 [Punica granatum]